MSSTRRRGGKRLRAAWLSGLIPWLALAVLAAPIAGQDARLTEAFTGETLERLLAEVSAAERAGLPSDPLVQKALEGRSKGASADQVVDAVVALRMRLASAANALGEDADVTAVVAAAAALYLGVDRETLRLVTDQVHHDALPMAFVVLGDLVKRGVTPARAQQAISSLGQVGADALALANFRKQVEADILTGVTPSTAVEIRSRGAVVALRRRGGPGRPPMSVNR